MNCPQLADLAERAVVPRSAAIKRQVPAHSQPPKGKSLWGAINSLPRFPALTVRPATRHCCSPMKRIIISRKAPSAQTRDAQTPCKNSLRAGKEGADA
jgi:hypothetical protein